MIYRYTFMDGTFSDVEVDEATYELLSELDNREKNHDRRHKRSCSYAEEYDPLGIKLVTENAFLDEIIDAEMLSQLNKAVDLLNPQQRELVIRIFARGERQENVAAEKGLSQQAISSRLQTIYKKLKKLLK